MSDPAIIDWWLAERVGSAVAGEGRRTRMRIDEMERWSREALDRVLDYTGMEPEHPPPGPELVGRREWLASNLEGLRGATEALEAHLDGSRHGWGPFGSVSRFAAGTAIGAQLGAASGYVARRILGQYDIALVGPARPARLLFVAPNLAEAQRQLGVSRDRFLRWIALHEATHAAQFTAVPWLPGHLRALVGELLEASEPTLDLGTLGRRLLPPDPRRIARAVREADLLSLLVSPDRRRVVERLQVAMAVVEGYSEHVMDGAARPSDRFADLRERMERARGRRGGIDAVLMRLLGLDAKLRQYRRGKAFADTVVRQEGIGALNRVWTGPDALPSDAELEQPAGWIRRMAA